jgi:NTP pyrophosphatase (non-canonical NTP hydrolase)
MEIEAFQRQMRALYGVRDRERGLARTFAWFTEECGELSRALFRGDGDEREHEFADVLAWLVTLASMHGVDLEEAAAAKYAEGCPRCHATPCHCGEPRPGHGAPDAPREGVPDPTG